MPDTSPSILLVDDEEIVLFALTQALLSQGYKVHRTHNPLQALEVLRAQRFALIISDHRMKEMHGPEFLRRAREIQPDATRILLTGALTLNNVIEAVNTGEAFRFIPKPWINEDLLEAVAQSIARYRALAEIRRQASLGGELASLAEALLPQLSDDHPLRHRLKETVQKFHANPPWPTQQSMHNGIDETPSI